MRILIFISLFLIQSTFSHGQTATEFTKRIQQYIYKQDPRCWNVADSFVAYALNTGDKDLWIRAMRIKGEIFIPFDQLDDGVSYFNNLLSAYDKDINDLNRASIWIELAELFNQKEEFNSSFNHSIKAYELGKEMKNDFLVFNSAMVLATTCLRLGRPECNSKYLMEAIDIALKEENRFKIAFSISMFLAQNMNRLDKKPYSTYLLKYTEFLNSRSIPFDASHVGIHRILGDSLNLDKLKHLYNESLQVYQGKLSNTLGGYYVKKLIQIQQYDVAKKIIEDELNKAKLSNELNIFVEYYYYLFRINRLQKNETEAIESYILYDSYKDSLVNFEILRNVDSLNIKYESAKKDALLSSQRHQLETSRRRNNFIIAMSLASVALLLQFLYNQRKKARYEQELVNKEKEIQLKKIEQLENHQRIVAMDHMLLGEEVERKRIAGELHDSLGAILMSIRIKLENLNSTTKEFQHIEQDIESAAKEVRRISHAMMPEALMSLGFEEALTDLIQECFPNKNVDTDFFGLNEKAWTDPFKLNLYRIVQEVFQNIMKHSNASQVIVQLIQDGNNLQMTVEDNGVGFDDETIDSGLGLNNIKSRVNYLNGKVEINSKLGGPTDIIIDVPLS